MQQKFDTVDEYVAAQQPAVRETLDEVRSRVHAIAPEAVDAISYQIPTFKLNGKPLIYIAAWQHHIAIYPIPEADDDLQGEIARYQSGKGTLRFPLDAPFPFDLVDRVVTAALTERAAV